MKLKNLFFAIAVIMCGSLFAQDTFPPTDIITGTFIGKTIPLRDFPTMEQNNNGDPKTLTIVPNVASITEELNPTTTIINNLQTTIGGIESYPIEQNFIGASQTNVLPPDPTGAVGPNHYVHAVNFPVKIFDKTGTLLAGPTNLGTFLGIGSNGGDPIVLYDQLADRWIVSQFGNISGGNSLAIGVSDTNDPTGAYNVYQFSFPGFPDYPHYSIWPDGYYGTVNLNGQTTRAFSMEKDVMLAGGASPQIVIFSLPGVVVNPNQVKSPE
ncbi:MAG: hypothetical protein DRI70_07515, partial [Bacteroidetes bacterium]